MKTIRILLADDHTVVRKGLRLLLESHPGFQVIADAANGRDAVALALEHTPDVVVMDVAMPHLNGIEASRQISARLPNTAIVFLSMHSDESYVLKSLKAGARAYLLKGMTSDELISTIRAVHAGKSHIPPAIAQRLAERMGTEELTPREFDVLEQIVHGKSNKEIATELDISEATVKTHINSLLGKLGVTDRTQAATAAIQRGLVTLESLRKPKP